MNTQDSDNLFFPQAQYSPLPNQFNYFRTKKPPLNESFDELPGTVDYKYYSLPPKESSNNLNYYQLSLPSDFEN